MQQSPGSVITDGGDDCRGDLEPGESERDVGQPAGRQLDPLCHLLLSEHRQLVQAQEGDIQERHPRADDLDGHVYRSRSAGCAVRYSSRSRSATWTDGTSGCSAKARSASDRDPLSAASIAARSDGSNLLDQAFGLHRYFADGNRLNTARADHAWHLHDRVLVQEGHAAAVGRVQNHHRRLRSVQRVHDPDGHSAVATRLPRGGDLGHLDTLGIPRLGHVGRLAFCVRAPPRREGVAVALIEAPLLIDEELGPEVAVAHRFKRFAL